MVRIGTYIIVGLLCLAMAGGVFLGGPPPTANNSSTATGPNGASLAPLKASDKGRLNKQRGVVTALLKKAGGDPASLDTVDGKLAAIQLILNTDQLRDNPHWELRCLGAVFGDALVQGLGMKWVVINDDRGRTVALLAKGTEFLAVPTELFLDRKKGEPPLNTRALFEAAKAQISKPAS